MGLSRLEPVTVTSVPAGPDEGAKELIDGDWAVQKIALNKVATDSNVRVKFLRMAISFGVDNKDG